MRLSLRIILFLCIPLFLLGAYVSIDSYFQAKNSSLWPKKEGVVLESRIYKMPVPDDFGGFPYEVFVEYSYQVEDRTYRNSTITYGFQYRTFNSKKDAEDFRERYPVSRKVAVYYNPENPEESCLETGGGNPFLSATGFLLSISCALLCFWGVTRQTKCFPKCT